MNHFSIAKLFLFSRKWFNFFTPFRTRNRWFHRHRWSPFCAQLYKRSWWWQLELHFCEEREDAETSKQYFFASQKNSSVSSKPVNATLANYACSDFMGMFGHVWACLGLFRFVWACLGLFGACWGLLGLVWGLFGLVRACSGLFGIVQACSGLNLQGIYFLLGSTEARVVLSLNFSHGRHCLARNWTQKAKHFLGLIL